MVIDKWKQPELAKGDRVNILIGATAVMVERYMDKVRRLFLLGRAHLAT